MAQVRKLRVMKCEGGTGCGKNVAKGYSKPVWGIFNNSPKKSGLDIKTPPVAGE